MRCASVLASLSRASIHYLSKRAGGAESSCRRSWVLSNKKHCKGPTMATFIWGRVESEMLRLQAVGVGIRVGIRVVTRGYVIDSW